MLNHTFQTLIDYDIRLVSYLPLIRKHGNLPSFATVCGEGTAVTVIVATIPINDIARVPLAAATRSVGRVAH